MAVVSESLRYVFLLAPRTGSTALGLLLVRSVEGAWTPPRDVIAADGLLLAPRKHTTLEQLVSARLLTAGEISGSFVFTAVRNPFDSLVSLWVKKRTTYQELLDDPASFINRSAWSRADVQFALDHSFDEWIARNHGEGSKPRHMYGPFIKSADFIMRFEDLKHDFAEAMKRIGVSSHHEIPSINRTEGREPDYRSYYSERSRRLVEAVFAPDLERFDYRF